MTRLLRSTGMLACAGLLVCASAPAETFDRGQALYENHCRSCHDETAHSRDSRRAASIEDLHKWVATWSYHAALGWSGEDVDDVVDYLNRRFYHFTDRP